MTIEMYDEHESWLTRQRAWLADLEDMGGIPHEPPPAVLDPLPWWKDADYYAQGVLDVLSVARRTVFAVVRMMLRQAFTGRHSVAAITLWVTVLLFATGYLLAWL